MEYERVDLLAKKLSNPRIEVRLRTANNILFKINNGLFDKGESAAKACIESLLEGVHCSLSLLLLDPESLKDVLNDCYKLFSLLLSIIVFVTQKSKSEISLMESTIKILELLHTVTLIEGLDSKLCSSVEEVTFAYFRCFLFFLTEC